MRIGVVADTHVPILAPQVPASLLKRLDECDHVIHAGDFHTYGVYEEFATRFPLTAVIGNRDEFPESEEVPEKRILEIGGFRIGITHGFGPPRGTANRVAKAWKTETPDLLIFGHSHEAGIHEIEDLKLLNPGSPTDTLSTEHRTFATLELNDHIEIKIHTLD